MMYCKSCGAEIPAGEAACTRCGRPVEAIVPAQEPETKAVAVAAPEAASKPAEKPAKAKPDKLILPAVMLIISGAGLVYLYISNTLSSIMSWFTSAGEEKHLREEIITTTDPIEYFGNIAVVVIAVLFVLIGIIGLVVLFRRLNRKLFSKKD